MKKNILLIFPVLLLLLSNQSSARYNPDWKWRTVSTDNFTIYYPEGHELLLARVLSLSDEVYNDVTNYLGVKPRRCPVVLNPGTDIFNGFYSPFPNRISLFETPMHTVKGMGPASDIMDLVFTHEYTHYVHLTTRLGLYGAICRVFGDGLAIPNVFSPGWIIEGVATNTETMFTDGGRGRCSLFRGRMMSFSESAGFWSLSASGVSPPYTPPADRIYLSGYHMVEYLNRIYGDESFPQLVRYQARHPLRSTRGAIKSVLKKTPKSFYSEFLADLGKSTQDLKDEILSGKLTKGKTVLSEPIDNLKFHFWTKNGTVKLIREGYDKKTALLEVNPENGGIVSEKKTGNLNNISTVRCTSEGHLVFGEVFYHKFGNGELDVTDLVVFDPAANKHIRITEGEHIYSADLSPDGKTFVAARRNGMWTELILLDSDGSNIRSLVSEPGVYADAPCWSPDGRFIASVIKVGQKSDIVLMDCKNGNMKTLFKSDIHEDNEPAFSPDGKWIVFSSNRSGVWNIFAWDIIEKNLYQLTSEFYAAGEPQISPDMTTLSFSSTYRGVKQLCTIPFNPKSGLKVYAGEGGLIDRPFLYNQSADIKLKSKGIPLWEAYKPFVHIPYFDSDEEGDMLGMIFFGADPVGLNSYTAEFLYGTDSKSPGYDISIINKSFWPTIRARIYDKTEKVNNPHNGENYLLNRGNNFSERGGELSLGLDIIHKTAPSIFQSSFIMGTRLRRFDGHYGNIINKNKDQSFGIFGEFKFFHIPDYAPRDLTPQWGQIIHFFREEGLSALSGEIPGHNTILSIKQFIPSLWKHHGLETTVTHQNQRGLLHYDNGNSVPRGYHHDDKKGDFGLDKNLLMSLEYHFPLFYLDNGIGLVLYHLNLIKGSFFVDYGAGWGGELDLSSWGNKARTSIGATFTTKSVVMSWLPVEFGIATGYKIRDKKGFTNLILSLNIADFNSRQSSFGFI